MYFLGLWGAYKVGPERVITKCNLVDKNYEPSARVQKVAHTTKEEANMHEFSLVRREAAHSE